jgi:signal transduction histidine kinase
MVKKDIAIWNQVSRDVKIEQYSPTVKNDSLFYRSYLDTLLNENEPYRVLLSPITIEGSRYVFMARSNLIESEDLVISIAILFCLTVTLLLTGLYFITRRLSFKLWLPFYSTLKQVEQFELDKHVKPNFGVTDVEEFNRLNQSINRLLEKNLSAYKDQKEFIENASHELQTPLAAFQAKLDTLAQQLPFTNELSKTLSDLNDSIARLNRINRNLLLLSKIENNQYVGLDEISVSEIVKKQVTFFAEQAEAKNVVIHIKNIEPCVKKVNSTLLEIAVSNLLLNAVRHNHKNGQIVICLYNETLDISNSGMTTPLQNEKLFQRFSQPGLGGGNGLGLAIVKKISDLHGWSLSYKYEESMHVFQVSF